METFSEALTDQIQQGRVATGRGKASKIGLRSNRLLVGRRRQQERTPHTLS